MESEKTEIDTGLIERCILDCNATRQALKDWEKTRDDDDFKDVIEVYYTESVATVQELQELKSIWEKVSVAQKAQIKELEEKSQAKRQGVGVEDGRSFFIFEIAGASEGDPEEGGRRPHGQGRRS